MAAAANDSAFIAAISARLGIPVPADVDTRLANFYKMINGFNSDSESNNIRILGDLVHDIGGLVNSNIGDSSVVDYITSESGLEPVARNRVKTTVNSFIRPGQSAKPEAIIEWLYTNVSSGLQLNKITNNIKDFSKAIVGIGCKGIILDSQFENIVEEFKDTGIKFFFSSTSFCDGAKKMTSKTVDELGVQFFPDDNPFNVLHFYNSRLHTFTMDINKKTGTVNVSKSDNLSTILNTTVKGGFSVNGITLVSMKTKARVKGNKQSNEDKINKPTIISEGVNTSNKKKELVLVKTITDYSQVYYAAFLYHILDYRTVFITNDTFCLPLTYMFKLPFVVLSKKFDTECFIFDTNALKITDDDKTFINQLGRIDLPEWDASPVKTELSRHYTTYELSFKQSVNIPNLISYDISIKDLKILEIDIKEKYNTLKTFKEKLIAEPDKLTDDDYKKLMHIPRNDDFSVSLNTFLYGSSITHINKNIEKNIKSITKKITASITGISLNKINEIFTYLNELLPNTYYLSEENNEDIISLLISLMYFKFPEVITYLSEYCFDTSDLSESNIKMFRLISRFIFVFRITFSFLTNLFFNSKINPGTQKISFEKTITEFIPIWSLIKKEDIPIAPTNAPQKIRPITPEIVELLKGQLPEYGILSYKEYMDASTTSTRGNPLERQKMVEYNKYITQLYSMSYIEIPSKLTEFNTLFNQMLGPNGGINLTSNIATLTEYRNRLFNAINSKAGYKDFFPVAFIDYHISKKEASTPDILQQSEHYLTIFFSLLGVAGINSIPVLSNYVSLYNSTNFKGMLGGRRQRGGNEILSSLLGIKPDMGKLDTELLTKIYSFKSYNTKRYYYKPSICSTYIDGTLLPSIGRTNMYEFIYSLLLLFNYDAIETNQYFEYQDALDDLDLFYFYMHENLELCYYFLLDYILNHKIIKSYFFNLLDQTQIIVILENLQRAIVASSTRRPSTPLSKIREIPKSNLTNYGLPTNKKQLYSIFKSLPINKRAAFLSNNTSINEKQRILAKHQKILRQMNRNLSKGRFTRKSFKPLQQSSQFTRKSFKQPYRQTVKQLYGRVFGGKRTRTQKRFSKTKKSHKKI